MDAFRPNEVISLRCVWYDGQDQPWLVAFEFAELNGRAECVGMSIRSYLALPVPDEDEPVYGGTAWVPGSTSADSVDEEDWSIADGEEQVRRRQSVREEIGANELSVPRTMRAVTLRELKFAEVLESTLRREVGFRRAMVDAIRGDFYDKAFGHGAFEPMAAQWEKEAAALDQPRTPSGRRRRYQRKDLERVAAVYRAAYAAGSRSPTKDVSETLGISRSTAAKLVMRCRDPRENLLSPTLKSKAGGTRPPQAADPRPSRESGQDAANNREEQL